VRHGLTAAGWRLGVDWDALCYRDDCVRVTVPALLFHGVDDPLVPIATSDAFAAARPDLVEYVRVARAGHVRSWNVGPQAYEARVEAFLRRILG
jgi:pimeloyl-ACP methyl ester carboxylesterase